MPVRQVNFKKTKIKSIKRIKEKTTVYDLVEPEHKLFITNNILTEDTVNFAIKYVA